MKAPPWVNNIGDVFPVYPQLFKYITVMLPYIITASLNEY